MDTINYYDTHAEEFSSGTFEVTFTDIQDLFLSYLQDGAYILDFGCGSGRDTGYFLSRGCRVDAIDGSKELCKIASRNTGIQVRHMMFDELNASEEYDAVWACSSILHLSKDDLKTVIPKIENALKPNGVFYTSFKYSNFEGWRNGRYFTDFTEDSFLEFIAAFPGLSPEKYWITSDVRPGRSDEKWLNLILKKN